MRTRVIALSLIGVFGLGLSACSGGLGDGVKLESLEIQSVSGLDSDNNPDTLEISQCGVNQLRLIGRWSDGDVRVITERGVWSSSDTTFVTTVNNPDVFVSFPIAIRPTTGNNTVRITSTFASLSASVDVKVHPGRLEIVTLKPTMLSGDTQTLALNHVGNDDVVTSIDSRLFANWSVSNASGSGSITVNNFDSNLGTAGRVSADGDATATITADLSRFGVDCGKEATVELSSYSSANLEITPAGPVTLPTHVSSQLTVDLVFPNGHRDELTADTRLTWAHSGPNVVAELPAAATVLQSTDVTGTATLTATYTADVTPSISSDTAVVVGTASIDVEVQDHTGSEAICFDPPNGPLALDSRVPLKVTGLFGNVDTGNCTADLLVDLTDFTVFATDEAAIARDSQLQIDPFFVPVVRAAGSAPTQANSNGQVPTSANISANYSNRRSEIVRDENGAETGRTSESDTGDRFTATRTYTLSASDTNNLTGMESLRIEGAVAQLQVGQRLELQAFLDFPANGALTPVPALLSGPRVNGLVPYPNRVTWTSSNPAAIAISNNPGSDGQLVVLKADNSPVTISAKLDDQIAVASVQITAVQ